MKTKPFKKYCDKTFGKNNYVTWLGMRVDEPDRLTPKPFVKYLADISNFEKEDILSFWEDQDFNLEIEEHLGNCVFCIKKSNGKLALAAMEEPEMLSEFNNLIASDRVRIVESRKTTNDRMYRKNKNLAEVIEPYKDQTNAEIRKRLRGSYQTNSCSESCEMTF